MPAKPYLIISGSVFGLVSLMHLLRLFKQWPLVIGSWNSPMWLSWGAFLLPALLSLWAFTQLRK